MSLFEWEKNSNWLFFKEVYESKEEIKGDRMKKGDLRIVVLENAKDLGNKIWKQDEAVQGDANIQKTLDTLVAAVTAK